MKTFHSFAILGLSLLAFAPSDFSAVSREVFRGIEQDPCTEKSAENTPGKWKKDVFNSIADNPGLPALVKKLEMQENILHKALGNPVGFDANCYFWVPENPFTSKKRPVMEVNVNFYHYYCDEGKLDVNSEYTDGANITGISSLRSGRFIIGAKKFMLLGSPIGEIKGYPAFEQDWTGSPGGEAATFKWTVFVSKKGTPLYRFATRKEVLDHLELVVEKQRPEDLISLGLIFPIRPADVQEAERKKELAWFIATAKDEAQRKNWTDRFNKDYRTDQQKLQEAKDKINASADRVMANLAKIRARYTPAELEEAAYMYTWLTNYNTAFYEEDFDFDAPKNDPIPRPTNIEDELMGKPLAIQKINYFDTNLPSTTPQYFIVSFSWTAGKSNGFRNEKYEKLRDDFFTRFDFDQLYGMLGK